MRRPHPRADLPSVVPATAAPGPPPFPAGRRPDSSFNLLVFVFILHREATSLGPSAWPGGVVSGWLVRSERRRGRSSRAESSPRPCSTSTSNSISESVSANAAIWRCASSRAAATSARSRISVHSVASVSGTSRRGGQISGAAGGAVLPGSFGAQCHTARPTAWTFGDRSDGDCGGRRREIRS